MRRLIAILLIGASALTVLGWLLAGPLLGLAIERAVAASAGALQVEGVRGTLFDGVRIARVHWREAPVAGAPSAKLAVSLDEVRIDWRPIALLGGEVDLSRLSAQRVAVALPPGEGASPVPASIGLPVALRLREVTIAELKIDQAGSDPIVIAPIRARLRYAPGEYRIERLELGSTAGSVDLSARVGDAPPFALRADATAVPSGNTAVALPPGIGLTVAASGTLTDIAIDARALNPAVPAPATGRQGARGEAPAASGEAQAASDDTLSLHTRLRPFDASVLTPVEVRAQGLDLRAWGPAGMPRTALTGTLRLEPGGPSGPMALSGSVRLKNSAAGGVADGALPLERLDARLSFSDGRLRLSDLGLRLVGAGAVEGSVAIDTRSTLALPGLVVPAPTLALALRGVDPAQFMPRLGRARVDGRLELDAGRFRIDLAEASGSGLAVLVHGALTSDRLGIARAQVRAPGIGTVQAEGNIGLARPHVVALSGRFDRLDPSKLADLPAALRRSAAPSGMTSAAADAAPFARLRGSLSGEWSLAGPALAFARGPAGASALQVRLRGIDGVLAGMPASGSAEAALGPGRIRDLRADLTLGATRLTASGGLGDASDRLAFTVRAESLAQLGPALGANGLAGSVSAEGALRGALPSPAIDLRATAADFRAASIEARALSLAVSLPQLSSDMLDAGVDVRAEGRDLKFGATPVRALRAEFAGSARAHTVRATLDAERVAVRLSGHGSLRAGPAWSGVVSELTLTGAMPARLVAPAVFELAPDALRLSSLHMDGAFGSVRVGRAAWVDGHGDLLFDASLSRLGALAAALGAPTGSGTADANLDALSLDLHAELGGRSAADATGRVSAKLRGGASGSGDLALALHSGAMSGSLDLRVPTLAFANRIIGPEWSVDGRLAFAGRVAGTVAQPRLVGDLSGDGLKLEQRAMGWRMHSGTIAGRFDGERFRLDALKLHSAGQGAGSVELRGEALADGSEGRFDLVAQRLAIPIGPGQRVVLSGTAQASSTSGAFQLKGRLRADEGRIDLAGGDAPSLPEDVVVRSSRREAAAAAGAAPRSASGRARFSLTADLAPDLGDDLRVYGSGLDGRLAGTVNLRGTLPQAPRAFGTVRIREGRYQAYGKQLDIVRGAVVFNGPLDNPALDILALRREQAVEAGVAITGTALAPQVRLASQPDVPDAEKLSWLVLGIPLENVQSAGQGAALQAAASSLFGRNDGALAGGLARSLGLDTLSIRGSSAASEGLLPSGFGGGGLGAALPPVPGQVGANRAASGAGTAGDNVVAIGKRLGAGLTVTYEQGLRGVWNMLRIQYDISRRLSVRAQTGTESALDLLYRFSFD